MDTPIKTNLVDSSFQGHSFTLGGDNADERPKFIEWDRTCSQSGPTFFTDKHLRDVQTHKTDGKKIALLIEPPSLSFAHYDTAWALRDEFDAILTFDGNYWKRDPRKMLYYPLGGSWIHPDDYGIYKKTREISMFASEKTRAIGHQLRHSVRKRFSIVDVYGRSIQWVDHKKDALAPYEFSIVIESVSVPGYFSEKIIDCLSVGTIALYWGAPDIEQWLPNCPIVPWRNLTELRDLVRNLHMFDFTEAELWKGIEFSRIFRCAEDRIFQHYRKRIWGIRQ